MSGRSNTAVEPFPAIHASSSATGTVGKYERGPPMLVKPGYEEGPVPTAEPVVPGAEPFVFKSTEPLKPSVRVVDKNVTEKKGKWKKDPSQKRFENYLAAQRARRVTFVDEKVRGVDDVPVAIPVERADYVTNKGKKEDETAEEVVEEEVPGFIITADMFKQPAIDMDEVMNELERRMGKRKADDLQKVPLYGDPTVQGGADWGYLNLPQRTPETGLPRTWTGPVRGTPREVRDFGRLQKELKGARIENRELAAARAQFGNQEASMLESNRSAAAALQAKEAQLNDVRAQYAQFGDQTTQEAQAMKATMDRMITDHAQLQDQYGQAQAGYGALLKKLEEQQQASLGKDARYAELQEELRAARAEAAADKLVALDTTKIDGLKAQHESMIKEANAHVEGLNKQIAGLEEKLKNVDAASIDKSRGYQAAFDELNRKLAEADDAAKHDITKRREALEEGDRLREELADLKAQFAAYQKDATDQISSAGKTGGKVHAELVEARAQLKAASDAAAAKDASLCEMEQQYRDAVANREKLSAAELLAIKAASEAKLAEVIAASNGANEEMRRQVEVINAQLRHGRDEGGEQYNYTVNVLAELKALLVQSVEHHETSIVNLQTNTVITETAQGRFDELRAQIEEVMATQKALATKPQPSIEDIVEAVAGRIAADRTARILAEGADMPEKAGDMGSGTITIVLVIVVSLVLFFYYRRKKRR